MKLHVKLKMKSTPKFPTVHKRFLQYYRIRYTGIGIDRWLKSSLTQNLKSTNRGEPLKQHVHLIQCRYIVCNNRLATNRPRTINSPRARQPFVLSSNDNSRHEQYGPPDNFLQTLETSESLSEFIVNSANTWQRSRVTGIAASLLYSQSAIQARSQSIN